MKFFHINTKGYMERDDWDILVLYVEKSISQIFILVISCSFVVLFASGFAILEYQFETT